MWYLSTIPLSNECFTSWRCFFTAIEVTCLDTLHGEAHLFHTVSITAKLWGKTEHAGLKFYIATLRKKGKRLERYPRSSNKSHWRVIPMDFGIKYAKWLVEVTHQVVVELQSSSVGSLSSNCFSRSSLISPS